MPETAAHRAWVEENTTRVTVKFNNRTDADILKALEGKQKQTEIKRLVRLGLDKEKQA